tara:strand:- start:110 stop:289 length:180 start_codon:yes stop_codon:yes gene_type:complete
MNISKTVTNAKYQQVNGENDLIIATIDGIKMYVPMDTANTDYQAILAWVAEGNTIQDAD